MRACLTPKKITTVRETLLNFKTAWDLFIPSRKWMQEEKSVIDTEHLD